MNEQYYEVLVNYGPFITIAAFFTMYGYTIYKLHQNKVGTIWDRIFFSVLIVALLPKFLAQLTLMLVHGAYGPFLAEISNLAPVIYIVTYNEVLLRRERRKQERFVKRLREEA